MTVARWIGLVVGLVFVLAGRPVMAQSPADAYFHEAARQYVDGDVEAARETVQEGLAAIPSDPQLQALLETLDRNRDDAGGGGSSQAGQRGDGDPRRGGGANQQSGQDNQDREETRSGTDESRPGDNRRQPPDPENQIQRQRQDQDARPGVPRPTDQQRRPGNALSRAQANRLLQALEIQEKTLLRRLRVRDLEQKTVEKDW